MNKLDKIAALNRAMKAGEIGFAELEEFGRVNRLFRIDGLTRPQIEAACREVITEPEPEQVAIRTKRRP